MRAAVTVESFLKIITGPDGTIDVSTLKKIGAGGTHDIYRSDKCPDLLIKVMKKTIGNDSADLSRDIQKLEEQYSTLYETFGESRCILEKRSIQLIKSNDPDSSPKKAIVSVVPFDPCFESKDKFGFNVASAEVDGRLIESKRYLYKKANKSLLSNHENPSPYVMRNYPQLNKEFENIFALLDADPGLVAAMQEFLTKYKLFYKKTGILLDTVGFDNVLFYKSNGAWQFKLGSVIKHDTGALTKKTLDAIKTNPAIVNESFEYFTSVCFMPACIRALNACAKKVGIEKIIDDIIIDEKTIDAMAEIHWQLGKSHRIMSYAEHKEFATALELYRQYTPHEKSDDTRLRDMMGTLYWDFIKKGGKEASRNEVEAYLEILLDKRNKFPDSRKEIVDEAINGLKLKLLSLPNTTQLSSRATLHKKMGAKPISKKDPTVERPQQGSKKEVQQPLDKQTKEENTAPVTSDNPENQTYKKQKPPL